MHRSRVPLLAVLLLAAAACGKSRQEEAFEQIERECYALVGQQTTYRQAVIQLDPHNDPRFFTDCVQQWSTIGGNDTCAPWTQANPQCQVLLIWVPTDTSLCEAGRGCCLRCELRIMGNELFPSGVLNLDAPICASRFQRGISC